MLSALAISLLFPLNLALSGESTGRCTGGGLCSGLSRSECNSYDYCDWHVITCRPNEPEDYSYCASRDREECRSTGDICSWR